MDKVENQLKGEIEKWTKRAKEKRSKIKLTDESKSDLLKNIDAYIKDSKYFLEKKDLVRSFEAIVWSWAWLEILEALEIIES